MSKPVVIFGAGASFDAIDLALHAPSPDDIASLKRFKLPLTDSIFHPQYAMMGFERTGFLNDFIPSARQAIKHGHTLEDSLRYFQATRIEPFRNNSKELQRYSKNVLQLFAVRYYLWSLISRLYASLIGEAEKKMIRSTNFNTFVNALTDNCPDGAVLITFNYDLFVDRALEICLNYKFDSLPSYYQDRLFPLFKLHGSVNWAYSINYLRSQGDLSESVKFIAGNPSMLEECVATGPNIIAASEISHITNVLPAIHIPLPDQKDFLIKEHKPMVTKALQETDKLILIGWSARNEYMVNLIKGHVRCPFTNVMVVSGSAQGNKSDADLILKSISDERAAHTGNKWKYAQVKNNGFSGVTMKEWDEFLRRE